MPWKEVRIWGKTPRGRQKGQYPTTRVFYPKSRGTSYLPTLPFREFTYVESKRHACFVVRHW